MVIKITDANINELKNEKLRHDARCYVEIYDEFIRRIKAVGIQVSDEDDIGVRERLRTELKELGIVERNYGKSYVYGHVSPACLDCRKGMGTSTSILSLLCNRDCYFCANKNQHDYAYNRETLRNAEEDFNKSLSIYKKMTSAALTGGEPLLYADKCVDFIAHVKSRQGEIHTRIYTNGDLAEKDVLKKLADSGLDEIRFGIKINDNGEIPETLMDNIKAAVGIIPFVMAEMPVIPGLFGATKDLLDRLNSFGLWGINLLEFLYPWVEPDEYNRRGFKLSARPYNVLFNYTYAGGLPVAGSETEALRLLKHAVNSGYTMGVHYCSLENKLTSQIWHHNLNFKKMPYEYQSPNDFFIKTARAYGNEAKMVQEVLQNKKRPFRFDKAEEVLEFMPGDVLLLKGMHLKFGLSYMLMDRDEKNSFLREIAIDCIDTETFNMDDI